MISGSTKSMPFIKYVAWNTNVVLVKNIFNKHWFATSNIHIDHVATGKKKYCLTVYLTV